MRTLAALVGALLAGAVFAPQASAAYGLLALMELNGSRLAARTDKAGDPILLMDQNRMLWDRLQIRRGLTVLARAYELGGGQGFYALQAAIVACHARAATPDDTDWPRIAKLYGELAGLVRSPVIELNRAVAIGMAEGSAGARPMGGAVAGEPAQKIGRPPKNTRNPVILSPSLVTYGPILTRLSNSRSYLWSWV